MKKLFNLCKTDTIIHFVNMMTPSLNNCGVNGNILHHIHLAVILKVDVIIPPCWDCRLSGEY